MTSDRSSPSRARDKQVHWRRRTAEVSSYMPPEFVRRAPRRPRGVLGQFKEVFSNRTTTIILSLLSASLMAGFVVGYFTRKPEDKEGRKKLLAPVEAPPADFVPLAEAKALKIAHELLTTSGLDASDPIRVVEFEKSRYMFIFRYEYQLGGGPPRYYTVHVKQDAARTASLEERSRFSLRTWLE